MDANAEQRPAWPSVIAGFALMFVLYQAAEGIQTVIAPRNPVGPALMLVSLVIAWPIGRWLGGNGYDRFGLALKPRWWAILVGGDLIAALAKFASLAIGSATGSTGPSPNTSALTASAVVIGVSQHIHSFCGRGHPDARLPVETPYPSVSISGRLHCSPRSLHCQPYLAF